MAMAASRSNSDRHLHSFIPRLSARLVGRAVAQSKPPIFHHIIVGSLVVQWHRHLPVGGACVHWHWLPLLSGAAEYTDGRKHTAQSHDAMSYLVFILARRR